MIPVRIEVEGFLCYRDRCVIDLEGCDLWVLSGRNGSGKSAIFDAMTYALFKAHRGGQSGAANLVHADAAGFEIAFEFDLGAERYRLKRSLRRGGRGAERQLYVRGAAGDDASRWPAVPETSSDEGLANWVAANVGLNYETFTSSVLLLQGKADRILGASRADRHAIVAGVVDLARFAAIHGVADERRRRRKAACEAAQAQLRATEEVTPETVAEADRLATEAEQAHAAAVEDWQAQVRSDGQSASWRDLVVQREGAAAALKRAREVLDRSEAIGRDLARLEELDAVVPALREAAARRGRIGRLEAEAERSRLAMAVAGRKLDQVGALAEDVRARLDALAVEIADDEARTAAIVDRERAIQAAVERARAAGARRRVLDRLERELEAMPDDLPARLVVAEGEDRDRRDWKAALPVLKTFARDRDALRGARDRAESSGRAADEARAGIPPIEAACDARRSDAAATDADERTARDRLTEATALRDAQARRVDQFRDLRDARSCDRCGQPLTPDHYDAESRRLKEDADRLAVAVDEGAAQFRHASARREAARLALATAEAGHAEARARADRFANEHAAAEAEVRNLVGKCADSHDALDDAFRLQVAPEGPGDWLVTTFPTVHQLDEGRRWAAGLSQAEARLGKLRADLESLRSLRMLRDREAEALAAIDLRPGDEAAEAERDALDAEHHTLMACLKEHQAHRALAEETRRLLADHAAALAGRRAEADKRLAVATAEADHSLGDQDRARSALPEPWRVELDAAVGDRIATWATEADGLRERGTVALAAELSRAGLVHDQSRSQVDDLDHRIAAVPEGCRLTAAEAATRADDARARLDQAEAGRREARSCRDDLVCRRDRREGLAAVAVDAEARFTVAERVAHLLGPRELQRQLLREAERGIVDRANPILGEISGGELQLRLLDGDGGPDRALELEALVRTHGRTQVLDAGFLSGSQKFRVAVSLALAIGQYARGKKERPIEAVVIDEGFGCLDRQGRDAMITQLKELKGRLARIVLVSHQEDFADSFDDGYRFSISDGATVVEPFHK